MDDEMFEEVLTEDGGRWMRCAWCGEWFHRKKKTRQEYCSEECYKKARSENVKLRTWERISSGRGRTETGRVGSKMAQNAPKKKKDGFTWDDVRAVLGEYGISSYSKALEILEKRKKEEYERDLP